jgi:hypothetical protein
MGFDEPELLINTARHFGEEVRSVGIAKPGALCAGFAHGLAKGGQTASHGKHVLVFIGKAQIVRDQE